MLIGTENCKAAARASLMLKDDNNLKIWVCSRNFVQRCYGQGQSYVMAGCATGLTSGVDRSVAPLGDSHVQRQRKIWSGSQID